MSYEIILHPNVLEKDFRELSKAQLILIYKQFKKLKTSPELGKPLGNKGGYNLTGYRKMYVDKKRVRIVYTIVEEIITVEVVAIGKRDDMVVYEKAYRRIQ